MGIEAETSGVTPIELIPGRCLFRRVARASPAIAENRTLRPLCTSLASQSRLSQKLGQSGESFRPETRIGSAGYMFPHMPFLQPHSDKPEASKHCQSAFLPDRPATGTSKPESLIPLTRCAHRAASRYELEKEGLGAAFWRLCHTYAARISPFPFSFAFPRPVPGRTRARRAIRRHIVDMAWNYKTQGLPAPHNTLY